MKIRQYTLDRIELKRGREYKRVTVGTYQGDTPIDKLIQDIFDDYPSSGAMCGLQTNMSLLLNDIISDTQLGTVAREFKNTAPKTCVLYFLTGCGFE